MSANAIYMGKNNRIFELLKPLNPFHASNKSQIEEALSFAKKESIWVVSGESYLDKLISAIEWPISKKLGNTLVLDHISTSLYLELSQIFKGVVFENDNSTTLGIEDLVEVLQGDTKENYAISGIVDIKSRNIIIFRGDFSHIIVPLTAFKDSLEKPDFDKFEIIDYGQTLKFGRYEASFESVLYENDPKFRKQLNSKRKEEQKGFGPSLRRLRKQKQISRASFAPVTEKTIARIERNEVVFNKIQGRTLKTIEKVLGINIEEIETY